MLASSGLFAVATATHWSIGSLAIRGDDVYAVVGLIAAIIVLSLWVVIENLWRGRWNSEKNSASRARQHTATPESPETRAKAEPDMTPVAARAEWLLDDNTLVRTHAVRRGPMRPPAPSPITAPPPDVQTDVAWQAPATARSEDASATQRDDQATQYPDQLSWDP